MKKQEKEFTLVLIHKELAIEGNTHTHTQTRQSRTLHIMSL